MNVLFVTREYPPFEVGGIAIHAFNLVRNLRKLGVSCKVVSFGNRKMSTKDILFVDPSSSILERSDACLASNCRIPFDILRFSEKANRLIANEHFDIVHVEEPYVGALIARNLNAVKISTFHSTSFGEFKAMLAHPFSSSSLKRLTFYSSLGFMLESMTLATSREIIVPTAQVRNELTGIYRTPFDKIDIIENGVDLPKLNKTYIKAEAKEKLGLSSDTFLIMSVVRMVARKRLDLLVEAIKILQKSKSNQFHVIIGGDGPSRPQLRQLVSNYGLEHFIELPGWVSNEQKDLYYRAADVFVLTSEYEGFPLSLLEAMSYGTPIITSKLPSLSSLRDKIDGLLFPIGDYYALSECIKSLMNDSLLRSELSNSARMFAANYDWKNTAEQTKKIYESIV